ncbi:run domain Beclin-1-interacting and cysteine-rich domain-containing protein-like [Oculina patagonica]
MADEEVASVRHAKERWSLLFALKYTIECILISDLQNKVDNSDSLKRVKNDMERIIKHGQRGHQGADGKIDKNNTNSMSLSQGDVLESVSVISGEEDSFYQALLDCSLSASNLLELVNKEEELQSFYQGYAFLRSAPHVEAMYTCIQAFEKGDCQLLGKIDDVLLNKKKSIELWLHESAYFNAGLVQSSLDDIQGKPVDELSSSNNTDSSSENDDFQMLSFYGSPTEDSQIEVADYSAHHPAVLLEENVQLYSTNSSQNFCYLPGNIDVDPSCIEISNKKSTSQKENAVGERNRLTLPLEGLSALGPSKIGPNVRATLAYAALSAVTEGEETATSPAAWFDGNDEDQFYKPRRASTGSLSENLLCSKSTFCNNGTLETSTLPTVKTGSCDKKLSSTSESVTDPQLTRKAFGHSRSKSDQIGVPKLKKNEFLIEGPRCSESKKQDSYNGISRLSSSLPTTSESLYFNDPYLEDPYQEQSLATILASQDFSSCELDKENAHFSISEALIAAIEQMKCDEVNSSEEEEDEEILHLKEELERKRREKKQRKHLQEQAAFSDETTQSTTSEPSTWTNSSRSAYESEDELSPEWEEITSSDKQLQEYNTDFSMHTATLVSVADLDPLTEAADNAEIKQSTQLSAETVAKSLLQKFANRKHPAASELQWLVSFQDAPQCLLPLPQAVAVAPDDVQQVEASTQKPVSKQDSLPCRIRGNSEWAPPRAQIIFHAHKPPRRKALMSQQNFRCAGCGMAVAPDYMKRFRYCHYLGKYFCSTCHSNVLEVIPARVIRKWDFTKYEVSNFARDLLHRIHFDPLFNLMDLNPSLYKRFRVLDGLKDIRRRLHFFKSFIQTCRKANELAEEFSKLPDHICGEPHLYSMHDLLQAHHGDLLLFLRNLGIESLSHINHCQLCLAKGFICEYCKNGEDVIFPFQLDRVVQCPGCHASFHKDCFVEGKCPKCERIRIRKQLLQEPVSPEEECSLDPPNIPWLQRMY